MFSPLHLQQKGTRPTRFLLRYVSRRPHEVQHWIMQSRSSADKSARVKDKSVVVVVVAAALFFFPLFQWLPMDPWARVGTWIT